MYVPFPTHNRALHSMRHTWAWLASSQFHAFLRRPWVFSRALGCGARRGPACTPRRKFGSRAGSVARALGVQSREIWQVITGLLSADLESSKTMGTHMSSHCCKTRQHVNSNRFELSSVSQLRTLLCVCGPLLRMCGYDAWMYALCVCSVYVCACVRVCLLLMLALGCYVLERTRTCTYGL